MSHCDEDCCNCMHEHESSKIDIVLYVIALAFFVLAFFVPNNILQLLLYGISIILVGHEVILEGIKNIFKLNFEEDTLMTIAVVAAFALGEYMEACLVLFLFALGEYLEERAIKTSRKNIEDIVSLKENTANVEENGKIIVKNSKDVNVGDTILIKPGERVPLDCIIISGETELDESSITGESQSVYVKENDSIMSGSINLSRSNLRKSRKRFGTFYGIANC